MNAELRARIKRTVKTIVNLVLNPRFMLCFGIAWIVTNGWAYVATGMAGFLGIDWLLAIGTGYLALLWLPFTPEKIITVAIAILLLRALFPNDQKTLAVLKRLQQSASQRWSARKQRKQEEKNQTGQR